MAPEDWHQWSLRGEVDLLNSFSQMKSGLNPTGLKDLHQQGTIEVLRECLDQTS
jgi:hypothetical protein